MKREPQRTEYIMRLYEDRNIEGLKQEQRIVARIIQEYSNDLMNALEGKEEIEQIIEYETYILSTIMKLLQELEETNKQGKLF